MESPSLDHMEANDHMGAYIGRWEDSRDLKRPPFTRYIGRWEDSRDLKRPPFTRRMWKVLEDSREVHTCVEEYGIKEIILITP